MTNLMTKIIKASIFIGVIMLVINWMYGDAAITLIHREQITGTNIYWYRIDTQEYILNIRNTFQEAFYLKIDPVPQTWIQNADIDEFVNNNIPYIVNWASLILNILILPIRAAFYILQSLLALVGARTINTPETNPLFWIIKICKWVVKEMQIPYIIN